MQTTLSPLTPFSEASSLWLENHALYIHPNTVRVYGQYVRKLVEFFGEKPLAEFHIGHVREYQRHRQQTCSGHRINMEVTSALAPILKEVNIWSRIRDIYRPLPVTKRQVRKNMSQEEELRLMAIALDASKPRRLVAGHCLLVMANTGMGFGELRFLRREDVFLNQEPPFITVNSGTKNDYRIRTIPLNRVALRSMRWILHRWERLGGTEPGQYILPHHAKRTEEERKGAGHDRKRPPDFSTPMAHIYRAARGILKEAGLEGFVPYDMRSHFATKLLSDSAVSDQVFRETFGHSNTRTRDRYSKQRIQTKAAAVDRLCIDPDPDPPTARLIVFPGGRAAVAGGAR